MVASSLPLPLEMKGKGEGEIREGLCLKINIPHPLFF